MNEHDNLEAERAAPCPFCGGELNQHGDLYIHPYGACFFSEWEFDALNVEKWNRRAPAVGEDGLPPLPAAAVEFVCYEETDTADFLQVAQVLEAGPLYTAEQVRQAQRDALAADRRKRRPRVTLDPELKAALEEAAKTRSTVATLPGGEPVFINYGDQPEDTEHLNCTACGGSGHIEDQRQIAQRPASAAQGVKTWYERMPGHVKQIGSAASQVAYMEREIADLRAQLASTTENLQTAVREAWGTHAELSKLRGQLARQSQEGA